MKSFSSSPYCRLQAVVELCHTGCLKYCIVSRPDSMNPPPSHGSDMLKANPSQSSWVCLSVPFTSLPSSLSYTWGVFQSLNSLRKQIPFPYRIAYHVPHYELIRQKTSVALSFDSNLFPIMTTYINISRISRFALPVPLGVDLHR